MILAELCEPVASVPGIGPRRSEAFLSLGVRTVGDLLCWAPRRYQDRRETLSLAQAAAREEGMVRCRVVAQDHFVARGRRVLKLIVEDGSGRGALLCYGRAALGRAFPVGVDLVAWGQFALRAGEIQASVFELATPMQAADMPPLMPVYPASQALASRTIRAAVRAARRRWESDLEDDLPNLLRSQLSLLHVRDAIAQLHEPESLEHAQRARERLVFGELFVFQLGVTRAALRRRSAARVTRPAATRRLIEPFLTALPFSLTEGQRAAVDAITADLLRPTPMGRLLQGDVGSGKTLVAAIAALHAIERGGQVAFMVPTELLARQHAGRLADQLRPLGIRTALLVGGLAPGVRTALLQAVADGEVDLVIGTHALFSDGVKWSHLSLAIIDEQHRFGVTQRQRLAQRGTHPDILLMSATPIPRSLALTAFGDTDVSSITDRPVGRLPVRTHLTRHEHAERAYDFVHRRLEHGERAYFVYPAIEEGGARELRSAEAMTDRLRDRLAPFRVGLAHSRLSDEERAETMTAFARGDLQVLVATSVIEVGVDVADATCIVIEHAELFGLAALHQLRGRVGRGSRQSWCFLMYREPLTDDARERLKVLYESNDGFHIAEEDLRIRGPGDLEGHRQAGYLDFAFADIRRDMATMIRARELVASTLRDDAALATAANEGLVRALAARDRGCR